MRVSEFRAAWLGALALAASYGANAQQSEQAYISPVAANAENIRSLNIMLMVTSLRCRTSAHDFRGEYDMFVQAHSQNLAEAHDHLIRNLEASYDEKGKHRALDRIGVRLANRFGDGHPTLGCKALKQATFDLARSQDRVRLSQMADSLLTGAPVTVVSAAPSAPDPRLQYEIQPLDAPNPLRPDGAKPGAPSPSRVPIWLRG